MRPSDLAHEHGISTQAVRNYERDGFLPPAERTPSGYRVYTEAHAAALRAYLALVPAHGYTSAGRIMRALHDGRTEDALEVIDRGHLQLLRDRETLAAVREALGRLTGRADAGPERPADAGTRTVGALARRLGVTPATLRNWEAAGILAPGRDPSTGYRVFGPHDVRDAELAHLLRRGGHPLGHIAAVVGRIRAAGGADALAGALEDWQGGLTARGAAMLHAAALLSRVVDVRPPAARGRAGAGRTAGAPPG
ncbi:MerR family DNA-binding transcriptional regulator [Nocardiopsis sp. NPDC101807]|uniref:MerR family DNA-binding transcriptional regulator n=1 Tax=Nocardiopsis sp. NPDC101807 TaxID=3364339 RepID=UPI0037F537DC